MAIDKLYGINDIPAIISRTMFEDTIAKFDEELANIDRSVIKKRLKKRLAKLKININGDQEENISI